ncbi:MAG: hypothetical protein FJ387_05855 [Verrucomicrobia bacterium]|nr:hypothetical protein [Verrucomicrobiota bacterium]
MNRPNLSLCASILVLATCSCSLAAAEDRRERVLADRREVQADARWFYNDFPQAQATAAATRKPMLVVFRCVP